MSMTTEPLEGLRANGDPLHEMKELVQWVCWQRFWIKGKLNKIPVDPYNGEWLTCKDPSEWLFYDQAQRRAKLFNCGGYGFVCTPEDGYSFIDIGGCLDAETKEITKPWVEGLVETLNSYTEISPSGTGLFAQTAFSEVRMQAAR